eukprot:scaffold249308_cov70-Cyclotella_meneghiniana.AAC.6
MKYHKFPFLVWECRRIVSWGELLMGAMRMPRRSKMIRAAGLLGEELPMLVLPFSQSKQPQHIALC